jgi:MYXO-CTERM domain-containing protein
VPDRGGLGAPCTSDEACASRICAAQGDRTYCTRTCDAANPCPREFACTLTADGVTSVCEPRETRSPRSGGCRCAAPGARSGAPPGAALLLSVLALASLVRRRR